MVLPTSLSCSPRLGAETDEVLKAKEKKEEEARKKKEDEQSTLAEQVKRVKDIEAIESDSFVAQVFISTRDNKKSTESTESGQDLACPVLSTCDDEQELPSIPTAIQYQENDSLAHPNAPDGRSPFSMVDSMMANMRNMMRDMHRNIDNFSLDSNAHSFSSSSVMMYSKVGDEHAKVFQASSQTRRVPGGIKETRRSLKDSESGIEKMAIGHHIHDRAHVIAQSQNKKTGDQERNEEFLNLEETEAQSFEEEWQRGVSKFKPSVPLSHLEAPKHRTVHRAVIAKPDDTARR
ncbi:Myeloid leukemia factor 1 [Acipenser ruthenus]|uniref:Myeloid leukemia factor 1 n=1 Tax=Acipenser ruthenus TaxID=7906 RepID=A0A444U058_ACIRT|nr:Myeloid leukemia factor 1 [Acipenser ruthenus]